MSYKFFTTDLYQEWSLFMLIRSYLVTLTLCYFKACLLKSKPKIPNPTTKQHAVVSIQLNVLRIQGNSYETCYCTVFTTFRYHRHSAAKCRFVLVHTKADRLQKNACDQ